MTNLAQQNETIRQAEAKKKGNKRMLIIFLVGTAIIATLIATAKTPEKQCIDQGVPIDCSMLHPNGL